MIKISNYIIYWFFLLLVVMVLNWYVENTAIYVSKTNKVDAIYSQLDMLVEEDNLKNALVIGNSYTNSSFQLPDAQINGFTYHKLIVNGMTFKELIGVVERLRTDRGIKKLLINIPYLYAGQTLNETSFYEKHWSEYWIMKLWWSVPLVRGRNFTTRVVKEDFKCLIKMKGCRETEKNETHLTDGKEQLLGVEFVERNEDKFSQSVKKRFTEIEPFTKYLTPDFKKELERLKNVTHEKGIKLFLYTAPLSIKLIEQLDDSFLVEFNTLMKSLDEPYVDLNKLSGEWDFNYFSDATHVNRKGGRICTEYLLSHLLN